VADWLSERKIDSLLFLALGSRKGEQRLYNKVWRLQRAELIRALSALGKAKINCLVFKGAEFVERYYHPHSMNVLADLDLLFHREDLLRVKSIFFALGYRQAYFDEATMELKDRDIGDVAAVEGAHYELAPFKRLVRLALSPEELSIAKSWNRSPIWIVDGECFVAVEFDVHHGVATDIDSTALFERRVRSVFPHASTLCEADQLWFTAARLYNEVAIHNKVSLRDFAYLTPLLSSGSVDWKIVLGAAREYEIQCPLFYYFSFLRHLTGEAIPAEVIAALHPRKYPRLRDWGWQLEKLLDTVVDPPFLAP